jgi:WD40 repeat protein
MHFIIFLSWASSCKTAIWVIGGNITSLHAKTSPARLLRSQKEPLDQSPLHRWAQSGRLRNVQKLRLSAMALLLSRSHEFLSHLTELRALDVSDGPYVLHKYQEFSVIPSSIILAPSLTNLESLSITITDWERVDLSSLIPMAEHLQNLREFKMISTPYIAPEDGSAPWEPFFSKLSPTLVTLCANIPLCTSNIAYIAFTIFQTHIGISQTACVGSLKHLQRLSQLRIGPDPWMRQTIFASRLWSKDFTLALRELQHQDCWKTAIQRLATLLPRFLPATAIFMVTEDTEDGEVYKIDSLFTACERSNLEIPAECLKVLWQFAAEQGCDASFLTQPYQNGGDFDWGFGASVLDLALEADKDDHVMFIVRDVLNYDVDLLEDGDRLVRLLNMKGAHPEFLERLIIPSLAKSLHRRKWTRRALSTFFSQSSRKGRCSLLFSPRLKPEILLEIVSSKELQQALSVDIHDVTTYNTNLLHIAARKGDLPLLRLLLAEGVNLEQFDDDGVSPLDAALSSNRYDDTVVSIINEIRQTRFSRGLYKERICHTRDQPQSSNWLLYLDTQLFGHTAPVKSISLKQNVLVSGSQDGKIIIWRLKGFVNYVGDEPTYRILICQTKPVKQVVLSQQATCFVSLLAEDNAVSIWDTPNDDTPLPLTPRLVVPFDCIVNAITLMSDSKTLVVALQNGVTKLINVASGECVRVIQGTDNEPIIALSCSPHQQEKQLIVTAALNGFVRVWNATDCSLLQTIAVEQSVPISSVILSPDDCLLGIATHNNIWRGVPLSATITGSEPPFEPFELRLPEGSINEATYSPNRYWVLVADSTGMHVCDLEVRSSIFHTAENNWNVAFKSASTGCCSIVISEDGNFTLSGWEDGVIRCWSINNGNF